MASSSTLHDYARPSRGTGVWLHHDDMISEDFCGQARFRTWSRQFRSRYTHLLSSWRRYCHGGVVDHVGYIIKGHDRMVCTSRIIAYMYISHSFRIDMMFLLCTFPHFVCFACFRRGLGLSEADHWLAASWRVTTSAHVYGSSQCALEHGSTCSFQLLIDSLLSGRA